MDWSQEKTLLELDVANLRVQLADAKRDIAKLAKRLGENRKINRRLGQALERKRVPVLIRVEGNGDVSVYGRNVEVQIVEIPTCVAGPRAMNLVEEWVDAGLPDQFRDLHLPGYCVATVNPRACRTLTETYEAFAVQQQHAAIDNLKGKSNAPTKDSTKEKDNRRAKTPGS